MDLKESEISKGEGIGRHPWEDARKYVVTDLIRKLLPGFSTTKKNVLDIGCGDTWLIENLSKEFPQTKFIAVDTAFDADLLLQYRQKLNPDKFEVYDNLETALEKKEEKVDLVLLLDVIEHIADDIGFLKWVLTFNRNIDHNTHFLISVPAFQSLFCSHDVFLGHYRRYDNKLLKTNIERAGLKSVKVGYFFSSLLPARILQVIIEKISPDKKHDKGVGGWKKGALDKLLVAILKLDYNITSTLQALGIKLPGLSNYILCKKRV